MGVYDSGTSEWRLSSRSASRVGCLLATLRIAQKALCCATKPLSHVSQFLRSKRRHNATLSPYTHYSLRLNSMPPSLLSRNSLLRAVWHMNCRSAFRRGGHKHSCVGVQAAGRPRYAGARVYAETANGYELLRVDVQCLSCAFARC